MASAVGACQTWTIQARRRLIQVSESFEVNSTLFNERKLGI